MRTTILGLRVLTGAERRDVQEHIALERAEFEAGFEGRQLVPFDREQIVRMVQRRTGERYVSVTPAFVRETRRRLPWAKRIIEGAK